jgi:hypothetical protein
MTKVQFQGRTFQVSDKAALIEKPDGTVQAVLPTTTSRIREVMDAIAKETPPPTNE